VNEPFSSERDSLYDSQITPRRCYAQLPPDDECSHMVGVARKKFFLSGLLCMALMLLGYATVRLILLYANWR
jgi:hypothetical protein